MPCFYKVISKDFLTDNSRQKTRKGYWHVFLLSTALTFLLFISLISANFSALAQTSGGGYSESYLLRNVGARAIAMAGSYTAISNEPATIFYNPAGLGLLSLQPTVNTMYSILEFGRSHSAIAWGQRFTDNLGFGFGINNFNSGSFMARDNRGNPLGNYQDRQISLVGGASYSIEFASVGVGVKYLLNTLQGSDIRANGFSVDIGTKFNIMDMFSFGLCVQNVAGIMYWNGPSSETSILPFTIRTGLATEYALNEGRSEVRENEEGGSYEVYVPPSRFILIGLDAVLTQYENFPTITLGAEIIPIEVLALRGGIALAGDKMGKFVIFPMTTWGTGVSIRPPLEDMPFTTHIDYSVGSDLLARNQIAHHLSLVFEF